MSETPPLVSRSRGPRSAVTPMAGRLPSTPFGRFPPEVGVITVNSALYVLRSRTTFFCVDEDPTRSDPLDDPPCNWTKVFRPTYHGTTDGRFLVAGYPWSGTPKGARREGGRSFCPFRTGSLPPSTTPRLPDRPRFPVGETSSFCLGLYSSLRVLQGFRARVLCPTLCVCKSHSLSGSD